MIKKKGKNNMNNELNHFDSKGNAIMVDVTEKNVTQRQAIARGKIFVNKETYDRILQGNMAKGDVLAVARVAGIMATKKTSELIPMCHPLMLTKSQIDFEFSLFLFVYNIPRISKPFFRPLAVGILTG